MDKPIRASDTPYPVEVEAGKSTTGVLVVGVILNRSAMALIKSQVLLP